MSISGVSSSVNNTSASQASSGTNSGTDKKSNQDLLDKAEAVAREGFELSLNAKQITNKYAAAKEVR